MSPFLILCFSKQDSFESVIHNLSVFGPCISCIFCPLNFVVKWAVDFLGKLIIIPVSIHIVFAISIVQDFGEWIVKIFSFDL